MTRNDKPTNAKPRDDTAPGKVPPPDQEPAKTFVVNSAGEADKMEDPFGGRHPEGAQKAEIDRVKRARRAWIGLIVAGIIALIVIMVWYY